MATSLLTTAEKSALNDVFDDIHETFARDIIVYKDGSQVVIITDPNFNPLYNTAGQTTSIINTPVYKTFKARIQYNDDIKKQYWEDYKVSTQIKLQEVVGTVRIKIRVDDYEYIKDGRRFELDGARFVLNSSNRPHGLFGVRFQTLYLKPDR